jgi:hypothetical protein
VLVKLFEMSFICGSLASLLWACGEAGHHGSSCVWLLPLGSQKAERERKGPGQDRLQRHTPVIYFLQTDPIFHHSTFSQESIQNLSPSVD